MSKSATPDLGPALATVLCGIFVLLVASVFLVNMTAIGDLLGLPSSVIHYSLPLLVVLIALAIACISVSDDAEDLGGYALGLSIPSAMSFVAVLAPRVNLSHYWFYYAVVLWTLLAVVAADDDKFPGWSRLLLGLMSGTSLVALVTAIGNLAPIPFAAEPSASAAWLAYVVDVRLLFGVLFGLLLVLTGVARAFSWFDANDLLLIPRLEAPSIPDRYQQTASVLNPLILVLNFLLLMLVVLANMGIGLVESIVILTYRTGWEILLIAWDLLFLHGSALRLLRTAVAAIATFVVCLVAIQSAPHLISYLRTSRSGAIALLPSVGVTSAVVILGAATAVVAVKGKDVEVARILFAASLLAALLTVAGGLLYIAALKYRIAGFESIGPLTLGMLALGAVGVLSALVIKLLGRAQSAEI